MASFEFLAITLTGLGLTASILYYTFTLQNANKTQQLQLETRQAQNFNQLWTTINKEFLLNWRTVIELDWNTYDDFIEKHWQDYETWTKISLTWQLLNPIGIHMMKNLIDAEMVYLYAGYEFAEMWERYSEIVLKLREELGHSDFMLGLEYLGTEMRERRKESTPADSYRLWVGTPRT